MADPHLKPGRPAAFIDRDGVINEERAYVHRIEDFALLPGVIAGLRELAAAGYALVVVTNQAGIARGYYDEPAMHALHAHMRALLAREGVQLAAIYHCPHHPEGKVEAYRRDCDCRKPAPGMILRAISEHHLDPARSVIIGDKRSDIEAGRAAGVGLAVLVRSGHALDPADEKAADAVCEDLRAAARYVVARAAG